ncbi:MAG: flagellar hook-length control protein FliK [Proteobacteria bacterium]|nr:flagellar hook-length control protein FliK [Pseudomonadota bacterium]
MQEIPAVKAKSSDIYDQLRSAALVDMSSQSSAFADFLGLMDRSFTDKGTSGTKTSGMNLVQDTPASVETVKAAATTTQEVASTARTTTDASTQAAQAAVHTTTAQSAQSAQTTTTTAKASGQESRLNAAKNLPVSQEAFEEIRPALASLGLSNTDIEGLSTRVKSGQLTWGQLVHTVSSSLTGAKKSVELSASQGLDLQSLFQKLGFSPDSAKGMVADVAKGDGVKVLAQIQQKLSTMPNDQTLGLDSKEMATLFKALRLPEGTANKLAQLLNSDSTVADLKGALELVGKEMLQQRKLGESQDTDVLRSIGKVMQKDVDKARREAGLSTGSSDQQVGKDSGQPRITVDVETPDRNNTKFFDKHDQQQKKHPGSEDASWREFVARVKTEDGASQTRTDAQTAKDSLETSLGKALNQTGTQQAKAQTSTQAKAWEKVAAPKLLNQVQEALLKDLGQGRKQITLDLDPANLGKLQIMLQVKGKEVTATLRADDPETAKILTGQLDAIKKSLEDQGLKVQDIEVQTGLASRQDQQLFSADQHNQAQERQDLSNLFTRLRNLRSDGAGMAQEMQNIGMQAILSDTGLHVIA